MSPVTDLAAGGPSDTTTISGTVAKRRLSKAELSPGDIVIREGTPPQPAPAKAGHFLDRAL